MKLGDSRSLICFINGSVLKPEGHPQEGFKFNTELIKKKNTTAALIAIILVGAWGGKIGFHLTEKEVQELAATKNKAQHILPTYKRANRGGKTFP